MPILALSDFRLSNAAGWVKTAEDVEPMLRMPTTDIVIGSLTVEQREGNREPTFWEAPDGSFALNSRGLPSPGIEYYRQHGLDIGRATRAAGKRLIASIVSTRSQTDWEQLMLCSAEFADQVELNLSCPNKWTDGENEPVLAENPEAVSAVLAMTEHVARAHDVDISVKLPPYKRVHDSAVFEEVLSAIIEAGCVAEVVSTNTVGGCPTLVDGVQCISMPTAGMSGPKILAWSLNQMRVMHEKLPPQIRRTGVGGVSSYDDAKAFINAGASGVQVGTHFFTRFPKGSIFVEIMQGLVEETT